MYAIKEVEGNEKGLKLNGTLHLLFYCNYASFLVENKHTFYEGDGIWAFVVVRKEFSLVENAS